MILLVLLHVGIEEIVLTAHTGYVYGQLSNVNWLNDSLV